MIGPNPDREKVLSVCPTAKYFLMPLSDPDWKNRMLGHVVPLRQKLLGEIDTSTYCHAIGKNHDILVNSGIISPSVKTQTGFTETLLLMGYETGSYEDIVLVSRHLTVGLVHMRILNADVIKTSEDMIRANNTILGRLLTGARFAEFSSLKLFADFINNLPD